MRHDDPLRRSRNLKSRRAKRRWLGLGASLLFLGLVVVILLNTDRFAIDRVVAEGTQTLNPSELKTTVNQSLGGRYGGLIPRRTVRIFPQTKVAAQLRQQFPNLAAVAFSIVDKTTLVVDVAERQATVVWCREATSTDCYFADETGHLFAQAPQFSPHVFLTIQSALAVDPINTEPLAPADFKRLINFRNLLQQNFATSSLADLI